MDRRSNIQTRRRGIIKIMIPLLPLIISGGKIIAGAIAGKLVEKTADKAMEKGQVYIDEGKEIIKKKHNNYKIKQECKQMIKELDEQD